MCYCAFDGKGTKAQKMYNCGHETVCTDCFAQMIVLKVGSQRLGSVVFRIFYGLFFNCSCSCFIFIFVFLLLLAFFI